MTSRRDAASLIRRAVRLGWTRSINVLRDSQGKVWHVQVSLRLNRPWPLVSGHIIVSFTRHVSGRHTASFDSRQDFRKRTKPGWWFANYIINDIEQSIRRCGGI